MIELNASGANAVRNASARNGTSRGRVRSGIVRCCAIFALLLLCAPVFAQQCGDYETAASNLAGKYGESLAVTMHGQDRQGNVVLFEVWLKPRSTWTILIRRQILSGGAVRDCAQVYASGDQWDGDIDLPEAPGFGV